MATITKIQPRPNTYRIDNILIDEYGEKIGAIGIAVYNPTTPLSLALCLSALPMREIRLMIAPLDPGHKGEALLNRIRM